MLEAIFGALVWAVANFLYVDLRRKGRPGFLRICAFWAGTPTTWLWLFTVKEGTRAEVPPPQDDAEVLLEEIRRDRALRAGTGDPAPGHLPPGEVEHTGSGEEHNPG